ncbi:hypothetical protein [Niabella aurantiaca]|uniref:hypothetical protein n=1 Tax=Niabella aurantiaca TaxID=379900 RepID=UPI00037EDD8A|nr:hypothetical protein [Niabella aurantiaca]
MAPCNDLYYLDGVDMYTAYGFVPEPQCSIDIISDFPFKERYSHDWKDENGTETDLDVPPQLANKPITLKGYIQAVSESDYASKRAALANKLKSAGTMALYHTESNLTHYVFCKQPVRVPERLTRIRFTNPVYIKVEIYLEAQHENQTGIPVVGAGGGAYNIIGAS